MLELFLLFVVLAGGAVLLLFLGALGLLLKLVFKVALIPLKIFGGLLVGLLCLVVVLPLALVGLPLVLLSLPVLAIVLLVGGALCLLFGLFWLGFHALACI